MRAERCPERSEKMEELYQTQKKDKEAVQWLLSFLDTETAEKKRDLLKLVLEDQDDCPGASLGARALKYAFETGREKVVVDIVSHESFRLIHNLCLCPLSLAIEKLNHEIISTVLKHKAWGFLDSSLQHYFSEATYRMAYYGENELNIEIIPEFFDTVKKLVEAGADVNYPLNKSPLQYAIDLGAEETACYLVENGADINDYCLDLDPPFQKAVKRGYKDLVRKMIDMKVERYDPHLNYYLGCLADNDENRQNRFECLVMFDRYVYPQTQEPLLTKMFGDVDEIFDSKLELLKLLFDSAPQYDVNVNPKFKGTALLYAACEGDRDCVEFLLQKGAHLSFRADEGGMEIFILEMLLNYLGSFEFQCVRNKMSRNECREKWVDVTQFTNFKQVIYLLLDAGSCYPNDTKRFLIEGMEKFHRAQIKKLTTENHNLINGIPEWCAQAANDHPSKRRKL